MSKIYVIEDELAISKAICLNLEAAGYDVVAAYNGDNVMAALFDGQHFDLALVDIMLPGKNGFELLKPLTDRGVPVIFLTAKSDTDSKVAGLSDGAEDYGNTLYMQPTSDVEVKGLEEKLYELKQAKANGTDDSNYAEGHSIDTAIAELENEIAFAKKQGEKQPASTTFIKNKDTDTESIEGIANVDGKEYYLDIKNWTNAENQIYATFLETDMGSFSAYTDDDSAVVGIDKDAALANANALLDEIGIDGMSAVLCEPSAYGEKTAWHMAFARSYDGAATTYTTARGDMGGEEESYSVPWGYELAEMYVDESGLRAFRWENPYENMEKVVDNCLLLPVDDVMGIFKQMIVADNAWLGESKVNINIDTITLGMMKIRSQGDSEKGVVVPVWDFFGSLTQSTNGSGETPSNEKYQSFLTINAIDGTIINRNMGY